MDESFLKKCGRLAAEPGPGNVVDFKSFEDLGPFGWLRGVRDRCPIIEFRKKTGNILALGYAWLHRIDFDPSDGITLWLASQNMVIRGQNLNAEVRPGVRHSRWARPAQSAMDSGVGSGSCREFVVELLCRRNPVVVVPWQKIVHDECHAPCYYETQQLWRRQCNLSQAPSSQLSMPMIETRLSGLSQE